MTRLLNRLLALIVGAALIAAGVVIIVEAIWTWTNSGFVVIKGNGWLSSFKTTPWSEPMVIAISVAVALGGLILFLAEVRPQAKRLVPFRTDEPGEWYLLRRSTEAHLQRRLEAQVPTSPIRAKLKPKGRRWVLTLTARAAASTRPVLEGAGKAELSTLHAPEASQVKVKTTGATKSSGGTPS